MKKKAKYNRIQAFDVILYIIMFLFIACILVPFLHVISVSLSDRGEVSAGKVLILPKGFDITIYKDLLCDGQFTRAYGNTLFYTVVGTTLSLVTTAMAAYALSRRRMVGHKLFSMMIIFTLFFSGGLIPTYLAVRSYGLINTRWAMILPGMINTWNLFVMKSFFMAYPQEIIESGKIDGLRDTGVFFRLVLPTSKAALATIGLYYAVTYWNTYMDARIYIRDRELFPVQIRLWEMVNWVCDHHSGPPAASGLSAAIMIVVVPTLCIYPFFQKYFVKGVMIGSIKG